VCSLAHSGEPTDHGTRIRNEGDHAFLLSLKIVFTPPSPPPTPCIGLHRQNGYSFLLVFLQLEVCMPIAATRGVGVEPGGTQGAHLPFLYAREGRFKKEITLPPPPPPPYCDRRAIQPNHIKFRTCSALAPYKRKC
jgi:hypothetical protein